MARTKQKWRKQQRGKSDEQANDTLDAQTWNEGGEQLNRKQKARKMFRQQQKVVRQLEKKYENSSSGEGIGGFSSSVNDETTLPFNEKGAEERKALIKFATKEAILKQIDHLLPSNKHKMSNMTPFISKKDQFRQIKSVKKQLEKMPFQSLKANVEWLIVESKEGSTKTLEGLTLAEELVRFADYVALSEVEKGSRLRILQELSEVIHTKFPQVSVNAFGSFSANLSIFLSDLDVSILFPNTTASAGESKQLSMERASFASTIEPQNKHIYIDLWEEAPAEEKKLETEDSENKDEEKQDESNVTEKGVKDVPEEANDITWTIDGGACLPGKNSDADRTEDEEGNCEVFGFDESDFIQEQQVSINIDEDDEDLEDDDEVDVESPNNSETKDVIKIDDYDDDSSSANEDDEEVEGEDGEDDEVDEEEDNGGEEQNKDNWEVEEDLDIQIIGLPPKKEIPANGTSIRSLHSSEMEFSNAFQFDSDDGEFVSASAVAKKSEKEQLSKEREVILKNLRSLLPLLRMMDWSAKVEFRQRAKVPIINFFHMNSVECDVSIGQAAKDTSELVEALKQKTGPALFILSAFLKVFLNHLDLDKPFTGGLGSFKLYLMIAKHVRDFFPDYQQHLPPQQPPQNHSPSSVLPSPSRSSSVGLMYGEMLLSFLQFYGNPQNLNEETSLSLDGAAVTFSNTRLAREIQMAFFNAHSILMMATKQRLILMKKRVWENEKRKEGGGHSIVDDDSWNEYSLSLLGTIIDSSQLKEQRRLHQRQCASYPWKSEEEKDRLTEAMLPLLLSVLDIPESMELTFQQIAELNPQLAVRLRSYDSIERLMLAISSQKKNQRRLSEEERSKLQSATSSLGGGGAVYSVNHYGVVGQSVAQSMSRDGLGLETSKRKLKAKINKKKKRKTSLEGGSQRIDDDDEYADDDFAAFEQELEERSAGKKRKAHHNDLREEENRGRYLNGGVVGRGLESSSKVTYPTPVPPLPPLPAKNEVPAASLPKPPPPLKQKVVAQAASAPAPAPAPTPSGANAMAEKILQLKRDISALKEKLHLPKE